MFGSEKKNFTDMLQAEHGATGDLQIHCVVRLTEIEMAEDKVKRDQYSRLSYYN